MMLATSLAPVLSTFLIAVIWLVRLRHVYGVLSLGCGGPHQRPWGAVVARKLDADRAKIPREWRLEKAVVDRARSRQRIAGEFIEALLDEETLRITAMDVAALVETMGNGALTAVQVVTAFCKRAGIAHQLSNLLLEIGFDLAIERAEELDKHFREHGRLVGPLHGVPVTLKDQFHIKGLETSAAYVGWIGTFEGKKGTGKEKHFESELVRELKSLGAVPIGKTTLVTSSWAPETNNNILGYARNPHNQRLSTGGSSGGEGAMQALRGSAFGIGTDSGGSVSMPASFQGVFSLKPSAGRISSKDIAGISPGQQAMPVVTGIMGHSVQTLRLVFRALLNTEPWLNDPYCLPIPYREVNEYVPGKAVEKPSFGFFAHDGIVTPHPPILRAMDIAKRALELEGYGIVDWQPPSYNESIAIHGPIARGDGCPDAYEAIMLSGEPIVPEIKRVFPGGKPLPSITLREHEQLVDRMKTYRSKWNDYWRSSAQRTDNGLPVGAVLSPVSPYAAVLPGKFYHSPYSSALNVLDYPTVVIPVTFADKDVDTVAPDFEPLTHADRINMKAYDPDVYDGAPASIQLFGPHLDEERLLSLAQVVMDALEKYKRRRN
ncbi:hypothetical protein RB594_007744 [Gaeumannomyces avenae]